MLPDRCILAVMSKIDTTADDLRNIAELSDFSDDVLTEAAALADHTEARPGDTLLREGAVSHQAYIVLQGHASVFIDGEPIASIGPSSLIGDVSLGGRPTPATVRAVTAMRLVVLGPEARATLARATVS